LVAKRKGGKGREGKGNGKERKQGEGKHPEINF